MASVPHEADREAALQASGTPPGVREITCRHCGRPALLCRADPATIALRGTRSKILILEPWPRPGRGQVVITDAGLALFTQRPPGDWVVHKCPAVVSPCRHCGGPVRLLHQPPGASEPLVVVEARPDPDGIIVVSSRGHAVADPGYLLGGKRFSPHTCHGRESTGTAALMREVPRGAVR